MLQRYGSIGAWGLNSSPDAGRNLRPGRGSRHWPPDRRRFIDICILAPGKLIDVDRPAIARGFGCNRREVGVGETKIGAEHRAERGKRVKRLMVAQPLAGCRSNCVEHDFHPFLGEQDGRQGAANPEISVRSVLGANQPGEPILLISLPLCYGQKRNLFFRNEK
jgi:hypothetical protein